MFLFLFCMRLLSKETWSEINTLFNDKTRSYQVHNTVIYILPSAKLNDALQNSGHEAGATHWSINHQNRRGSDGKLYVCATQVIAAWQLPPTPEHASTQHPQPKTGGSGVVEDTGKAQILNRSFLGKVALNDSALCSPKAFWLEDINT